MQSSWEHVRIDSVLAAQFGPLPTQLLDLLCQKPEVGITMRNQICYELNAAFDKIKCSSCGFIGQTYCDECGKTFHQKCATQHFGDTLITVEEKQIYAYDNFCSIPCFESALQVGY